LWDLSADPRLWTPFAILLASFLGSAHCVGMCGGLVLATARKPHDWVRYQGGRLLSYLLLGALAGGIGASLLPAHGSSPLMNGLSWVAATLLGLSFLVSGVFLLLRKPLHIPLIPSATLSKWIRASSSRPHWVGLLSGFLPCGWLHTFVLGAVTTRSSLLGAAFLFFFWAGSLPALGLSPLVIRSLLSPLSRMLPRIAGVLLMLVGLWTVGIKIYPSVVGSEDRESCKLLHSSVDRKELPDTLKSSTP